MKFPQGVSTDSAKAIEPGRSETSANASFLVEGDPGAVYQIFLPTSPVRMTTGKGTSLEVIWLTDFKSYPSETGVLDQHGRQIIYVGATRQTLGQSQAAGVYSGDYNIAVSY